MKYLFISHAEKDSEIVRPFVELLYRIGLDESHIFCSSISELGVPIKEDIYDYLRNILDTDTVIPVFMLSENYYASAACLNEMGAVWLRKMDYYTFLLPGFTFRDIKGAIDPSKRAIKLDNALHPLRADLTLFKNSLCKTFNLTSVSEQRWETYREAFIKQISNCRRKTEIIIDLNANQSFCIGDINRNACMAIMDSTQSKIVFTFDFYKTTAQLCSMVLFTGEINIKKAFQTGMKLEFWARTTDRVKELSIEMHLSSMNPAKSIQLDREWVKYSILLSEFTTLEKLWECCKEICFVVDRVHCKRGTVEVKDIRIT